MCKYKCVLTIQQGRSFDFKTQPGCLEFQSCIWRYVKVGQMATIHHMNVTAPVQQNLCKVSKRDQFITNRSQIMSYYTETGFTACCANVLFFTRKINNSDHNPLAVYWSILHLMYRPLRSRFITLLPPKEILPFI